MNDADSVQVQLVGGPTVLLDIGGLRLLTDPTFDPPGDHPVGERVLVKTRGPALDTGQLGPIDAVLLSHDQHPDNLDDAGRRYLAAAPLTLTTSVAEARLGGTALGLLPWSSHVLHRPDGRELRVLGVPAQHGPDGTEALTGPVIGFVLSGPGSPTVYVSGDNASLPVVQEIADRAGPIDLALLFAGAARSPLLDGYLTFGGEEAARAAALLGAPTVVPVHTEGWGHFTEPPSAATAAFARHGLQERLVELEPGRSVNIGAARRH